MAKWRINLGSFVRSWRQKSCEPGLKPGLPPDPNVGKVSFIAPHTRGTEKMGHEQDSVPEVWKDQVRY